MRPDLLNPLFAPVSVLDGVGPKLSGLIARIVPGGPAEGEPRLVDLLLTLPHSIIDRRSRPGVAHAPEGAIVTLDLRIDRHQAAPPGKKSVPYRIYGHDETGEIALVFFHARADWLERALPVGEDVVVSGRMEWFNGRPNMVHPDYMSLAADAANLPLIDPVYPLTAGLSGRVLRKAVHGALERLPDLPEWLDGPLMARQGFLPFAETLRRMHSPRDPLDIAVDGPLHRRLAYDELLAGQLALALVRARLRRLAGRPLHATGVLQEKLRDALPYALTGSQEQAVSEIAADLENPQRMLRLLQGDVGSGKTVVALMAMVHAAEAGGQSVLMAPTEILARQHLETIAPLAEKIGLNVALLTGRGKAAARTTVLNGLADGSIDIVVGTQAVFQEGVAYKDLTLAVIDEQHRFGVHQRLALTSKGDSPDMLVMTATPIPRTLVLTAFGDMDVSRLTEKPAGRQPVATVTLPLDRLGELVARIRNAVDDGQKIYWICPLVEESEEIDLTSAADRHEALQSIFGERAGLVHGRMTTAEKDEAMEAFRAGATRILVATTVIEVGVDVPDATIIVIEHAERFGLAQLHQLRGRVGRGSAPSTCVMLFKAPLGETAKARLTVMRETEDGFRIAEDDLKLRGEGEILGTRQSGAPGFQLARLDVHGDLLETARNDARLVLATDPELAGERGAALRVLLYLFGRDDAVRLLRAG